MFDPSTVSTIVLKTSLLVGRHRPGHVAPDETVGGLAALLWSAALVLSLADADRDRVPAVLGAGSIATGNR